MGKKMGGLFFEKAGLGITGYHAEFRQKR